MRYAKIDECEVVNGSGVGMSLYVQGCDFHCNDCFNSDIWDYDKGSIFDFEILNDFIESAKRPYIKRISILGGEPLADKNVHTVLAILRKIRITFGTSKSIWLYTGFCWEEIFEPPFVNYEKLPLDTQLYMYKEMMFNIRTSIIHMCDIVVDGRYIKELADSTYPFAGSTNQRLIDIQKSIKKNNLFLLDINNYQQYKKSM